MRTLPAERSTLRIPATRGELTGAKQLLHLLPHLDEGGRLVGREVARAAEVSSIPLLARRSLALWPMDEVEVDVVEVEGCEGLLEGSFDAMVPGVAGGMSEVSLR